MTTLLLARHGETDWNRARRWQGHADRPLTDRGRAQATALAERLADIELDAVYSSDLRRARETAEAVARAQGLDVVELPELREVDVGSWEGLTRDEAEVRFPDGFRRWRAGGTGWNDGETYAAMSTRVLAAADRIANEHEGGRTTGGSAQWSRMPGSRQCASKTGDSRSSARREGSMNCWHATRRSAEKPPLGRRLPPDKASLATPTRTGRADLCGTAAKPGRRAERQSGQTESLRLAPQ